jgi:hypothetical protein
MRVRYAVRIGLIVVPFLALLGQHEFRDFGYLGEDPTPTPPDANEQTEWTFGRLRYPGGGRFGGFRRGGGAWTTDFPRADRQFVRGIRRLTRIHARSAEQIIDLEDGDEVYHWPWLYAVEVGQWSLSDEQCKKLRDYLLRGGFFMVDDFHGGYEWESFMASMSRVFPDRPVVEIEDRDPIFHILYDLDDKVQVPGVAALRRGLTYERFDSQTPHWRGIYDDKGRIMVAIIFNQDYGDAWQWADDPGYPEKMTGQAYRVGINYIMYSMTH